MKSFLKSTIKVISVFSDFWVITLCSFVFSFILIFSTSLLKSMTRISTYFSSPLLSVEKAKNEEESKIENLSFVKSASPVQKSVYLAQNDKFYTRCIAYSVDFEDYFTSERESAINLKIQSESIKSGVVASKCFMSNYGLKIGDKFALIPLDGKRAKLLQIVGVYATGLNDFDNNIIFLNINKNDLYSLDSSFDIIVNNSIDFKVFSKPNLEPNIDYSDFDGIVDYYRLSANDIDENMWQSFNSIKFVLLLFAFISIIYTFFALRAFNSRNKKVFEIYNVLGCRKLELYKYFSSLLITTISAAVGLFTGILLAYLTPVLVNLLDSFGLNLGYYARVFKIEIFNIDLLYYILLILAFTTASFFTQFLANFSSKNKQQ